jgi:ATP-dependent 26S proteasome regulatory subunit
MSEEQKDKSGFFKVKSITDVKDLKKDSKIPESDLTIQENGKIYQFEHVEPEEERPAELIKPGSFTLEDTSFGIKLKKMPLRNYNLLKSIDNTKAILAEANKFFSKLDVYKELKRDPKRAVLLCSPPGVGKTAAITDVCQHFLKDKNTSVVTWDTSATRSSSINRFFLQYSQFHKKTERFIFVMEDIGGGTVEENHGPRGTDSSLLNLLDGIGNPFKGVPTFIIATTNNPEQSVGALIDRPGRFDKVIELKTPNEKECLDLLAFIAGKKLTEEDEDAARLAAKNKFSIAHLQEVVVRSRLDDVSMLAVVEQLVAHKARVKSAFQDTRLLGIGRQD